MSGTKIDNELHTQIQYSLIEKLSESERRYRELVESLREIVFKCDRIGHLTFVNQAWTVILGYPVSDAIGKPLLNFIDESDRHKWCLMLSTPYELVSGCHEFRFCNQNGVIVWLELSVMPSGEAEFSGSLRDITERKIAEKFLKQANSELEIRVEQRTAALTLTNSELTLALQELQRIQVQLVQAEKMSALGNLVAGVAHEINNPVGFIAGNIEPALLYVKDIFRLLDLYQQEYPNSSDIITNEIETVDLDYIRKDLPKLLNSMLEGVNRICSISNSLRTFSRADSENKVVFNIHDGIDSTILILKHRLKADENRPAIEVITNYDKLPQILCFPGQLNQVFMNLIANAIDALEESNHGRSFQEIQQLPNIIKITTHISDDSQHVAISIKDNGKGMSEAVKQRIFDHLFTTKGVGKGTGLGLAIAQQIIIEKHAGTIEVNSQLGEGTEFVITIPV